jgi:hypothetical protein
MCLEATGDADDAECNGKAVGHSCTHSNPNVTNAICTHDPRTGSWMCSAPKTEAPVFAVCEGMEKGTPCSYTAKIDTRFDNGMDSGLIQGACDLYDKTHTAMMCLAYASISDSSAGASTTQALQQKNSASAPPAIIIRGEDEGSPTILIIAVAAASLVVGCVAGASGGHIMQGRMQQKKPETASPQMAPFGKPSPDQKGEEVPSEASSKDGQQHFKDVACV